MYAIGTETFAGRGFFAWKECNSPAYKLTDAANFQTGKVNFQPKCHVHKNWYPKNETGRGKKTTGTSNFLMRRAKTDTATIFLPKKTPGAGIILAG